MAGSAKTFLTGANAAYIAELYAKYKESPHSIDQSWIDFFSEFSDDVESITKDYFGASWSPSRTSIISNGASTNENNIQSQKNLGGDIEKIARRSIRARILIRSYRVRGHLHAQFDPLGLSGAGYHKELDYRTYDFTENDLDKDIYLDSMSAMAGREKASLKEILKIMQDAYCGSIGVEYMHIQEIEERAWIQNNIEGIDYKSDYTSDFRANIYKDLVRAEGFETYLQMKHTGTKRFGLDGGESLIPFMEGLLTTSASEGIEEIVIGMPHRGRLNVLARTMGKPYAAIFSEFQGNLAYPEDVQGSGDVKYHLGASADREFGDAKMHLSLTANPSHLECVNPVVLGKVRAKQAQRSDETREKVMGILMHGDAAFAGQGIVPETLDLSQIKGYRTGGTIHVVVNNQIGFTTNPTSSRSTPYPTDIAKGMQAPIFHVNGDDPEAVIRVAELAVRFRQRFKRDVVIDLFCYRRHGHNEGDEPMFTQPKMYTAIADHPTTREIYREKLLGEGILKLSDIEKTEVDFKNHLDSEFVAASGYKSNKVDWLEGKWEGLTALRDEEEKQDEETSVDIDILKRIGNSLSTIPEGIIINSKLIRQLKSKSEMMSSGANIDWAMAEALAYGSLLLEGHPVRLSGQDSGRGTFSHRHAAIIDQKTEDRYFPLSEIDRDNQAAFEIMDSPLSEFAVLGYEYGYSLAEPKTLTIWEAQFGDFANTAQVIFDQFISSGESKWLRMSGLVMLLPHGMEGQGPEHSSARLERCLQLCAEDNMQVVNITSPANFFHVLRRQVKRNYRKPLIVMSPKSLLRHKLNVSSLSDMASETGFLRIIPEVSDNIITDKKVRRVILCSGKIYYDLFEKRDDLKIRDVVIIRIEQLYPWPRGGITKQIRRYANAEILWVQEESSNQGAWHFVNDRLNYILRDINSSLRDISQVLYVGRKASASPATGALSIHKKEQDMIINQALNGETNNMIQPFMPPAHKPEKIEKNKKRK